MLKSESIDYYKIIGVLKSDSQEVINRKCNEKLSQYHPDKIRTKLQKFPQNEQKKKEEDYSLQYNLIRKASHCLKDPQKRELYNAKNKLTTNNFVDSRESFEKFKELQEKQLQSLDKKDMQLLFDTKCLELDIKHKFDKKKCEENAVDGCEFNRRMGDLRMDRTQQEIEFTQKNLFAGSTFDIKEFNKCWDIKQKNKSKSLKNTNTSIVQWEGISAANDTGITGGNYSAIDEECIYVEGDTIGAGYSRALSDGEKSSSEDYDSDNDIIDDCAHHFKSDKVTDNDFNDFIKKRQTQSLNFPIHHNNDSMSQNPYNFVHNNKQNLTNQNISKNVSDAFKELLNECV